MDQKPNSQATCTDVLGHYIQHYIKDLTSNFALHVTLTEPHSTPKPRERYELINVLITKKAYGVNTFLIIDA